MNKNILLRKIESFRREDSDFLYEQGEFQENYLLYCNKELKLKKIERTCSDSYL